MSLSDTGSEYVAALGKAAPPLTVAGVSVTGMTLQDWVLVTTLIYTVLQTAVLVSKFFRDRRGGR